MYTNYQPDFENLRKALTTNEPLSRIPQWELFHDVEVMEYFLGEKLAFDAISGDGAAKDKLISQILRFQLMHGYDFMRTSPLVGFTFTNRKSTENTAEHAKEGSNRTWVDESSSTISSWEDFENYKWPKPNEISYELIERSAKLIPDGMKMAVGTSGVLENVQWLMGYEAMAFAVYDDPDLIAAMFEKVGSILLSAYENAAQMDKVGMMAMGDDMGFKGGTLFAPDFMRKYVFPWQKKCVDVAHKSGHFFVLHSCGNLDDIMDDLIDYVGIDAKHSFEDVITPVEEAHKKYHKRVGIVGGLDVDLLCRGTEEEVRKRTREILEACAPQGRYAMGSGNSVTNYMNLNNYLAMHDETRKFKL